MASVVNNPADITEHMTRLRMRLLKEKVDRGKQSSGYESDDRPSEADDSWNPQRIRYHQNLLKRQELLEKLKGRNAGRGSQIHKLKENQKIGRRYRPPGTPDSEFESAVIPDDLNPRTLTPTNQRNNTRPQRRYSAEASDYGTRSNTPDKIRQRIKHRQQNRSMSRQSLPAQFRGSDNGQHHQRYSSMGSADSRRGYPYNYPGQGIAYARPDPLPPINPYNQNSALVGQHHQTIGDYQATIPAPPYDTLNQSNQPAQLNNQKNNGSQPLVPGQQIKFPDAGGFPQMNLINSGLPNPVMQMWNPSNGTERKPEYLDMMMMQSWQMQQYFMQHLLVNTMNGHVRHEQTTTQPVIINEPPPQQPQIINIPGGNHDSIRPPSIHHHHYAKIPSVPKTESTVIKHYKVIQPEKTVPQPKPQPVLRREPVMKKSPESYPRSVSPLQLPEVRSQFYRRPEPASRPAPESEPVVEKKHPFPGSRALRKLRHIFYAAWFISFLKIAARRRANGRPPPDDRFLFGIQLKEAVASLHRIYLNPDGNIFPLLRDCISGGSTDLSKSFTGNQKVLQELVFTIENLVFHITEIMPRSGVLGTHRKAVTFEMLKKGKMFPEGYFWQVEKDRMKLDADGRTLKLDDHQARLLLVGIFLSRSLVTTLMMKPLDYGLSSTLLDETAERNLRLLASLVMYIVRITTPPKNQQLMEMPYELSRYLLSDSELQPILTRIKKTTDYATELVREWTQEYTNRLRSAKPEYGTY